VKIRNVTGDDIRSFVQVYREAYAGLEEYAYRRNREIKNYFRWLIKRDADGLFLAETDEKEVVGFVACDANWFSPVEGGDAGEIHELFVKPEFQRRGVGRALLKTSLNYMKSKRKKYIGLWVGISNNKAIQFYRKMGFTEDGTWGKWLRMTLNLYSVN